MTETQADWPGTFRLINRVVELEPENVEAQLIRARLLLASGRLDEALTASDTVLELAPARPQALALRAAVLYKLEDTPGALALAREALAQDPGTVDALAVLATERLANGAPGEALPYLDRALETDETNAALRLLKIEALTRLDDAEAIEAVYRQLIARHPETRAYQHRLAAFYLERFREQEAEQVYRDIAEANPEDLEAQQDVVRFLNTTRGRDAAIAEVNRRIEAQPDEVEWYFVLAQLHSAADDKAAAESALERAVARAAGAEDRHRAMGELASYRLQAGDREAAMALVDAILAEDPRNEQAVVLKAAQQIDAREFDTAISALRTVLADSPSSPRALLLLGSAHELQGASDLAGDVYARAFEAGGQSLAYGLPYARFLARTGRAERAASVLEAALPTAPDNVAALTLLAQLHLSRGDWVAAQEVADRIRELDDPEGVSQQIMGAVYAGQRNYDKSIEALQDAYRSSAAPTRPMVSLVRTYLRAGKPEAAHEFLDSVLAVNDDNQQARLLKAQLYRNTRDYDAAAALLEEVIAADTGSVAAYRTLAGIQVAEARADEALATLEQGLAANPDVFELQMIRASMLEQQGRWMMPWRPMRRCSMPGPTRMWRPTTWPTCSWTSAATKPVTAGPWSLPRGSETARCRTSRTRSAGPTTAWADRRKPTR